MQRPRLAPAFALVMPLLLALAAFDSAPETVPAPAAPGPTLRAVRAAGQLACGVVNEPEDWTKSDLHAGLAPFGVELCKAVAVAALGAKAKVDVHPYASALEAGEGLARGEVPLVFGVTPNLTATWHWPIAFGRPVFYDGQSVLVRGDAKASSRSDLAGMKVCYVEGTENEAVLQAWALASGVKILPLPFQEEGEMEDALSGRHCDAISAYVSRLALERASFPRQLGGDDILPDWFTLDPIAPAYRDGDAQWAHLVDATMDALIQAEDAGITRDGVGEVGNASDPLVQRLLGTDWAAARALGLDDHGWAATVIATVGNYGEIYGRTVGAALHLPRGRNALWRHGGLLAAQPVQ